MKDSRSRDPAENVYAFPAEPLSEGSPHNTSAPADVVLPSRTRARARRRGFGIRAYVDILLDRFKSLCLPRGTRVWTTWLQQPVLAPAARVVFTAFEPDLDTRAGMIPPISGSGGPRWSRCSPARPCGMTKGEVDGLCPAWPVMRERPLRDQRVPGRRRRCAAVWVIPGRAVARGSIAAGADGRNRGDARSLPMVGPRGTGRGTPGVPAPRPPTGGMQRSRRSLRPTSTPGWSVSLTSGRCTAWLIGWPRRATDRPDVGPSECAGCARNRPGRGTSLGR
jgi:hypothetical protein